MKRFNLISAPFSSGLSWVVSVLMELGIRTTHEEPRRYPNGFWRTLPDADGAEEIVAEGVSHMRYYLPALHVRNSFHLQAGLEVLWEHRLDFARHIERPVILFVRDPRDAIRSLYLRNYSHLGWLEYLRRPDRWPDHFPEMFDLPPTETWAVWHAMWLGLDTLTSVKCLRFEDSRLRPVEMVRDILRFLGVERSAESIQRAVENSTFDRTKAAMEKAESETGERFQIARRGKVGEWQEIFDDEALRSFGGPAAEWMRQLGYEPTPASLDLGSSWELTRESEVSEFVRRSLGEFRRCWEAGDVAGARKHLLRALPGVQSPEQTDSSRLWVAASWVALDWTARVLGESMLQSPVARGVFASFSQFNHRFAEWPSVRQMLLRAVTPALSIRSDVFGSLDRSLSARPVAESRPPEAAPEEPRLVEEDYLGYRVLGFRGRFYAVAHIAGRIELATLSMESLSEEQRRGNIFTGDLGFEVREKVDRFIKMA